jgi:hypothetical protein
MTNVDGQDFTACPATIDLRRSLVRSKPGSLAATPVLSISEGQLGPGPQRQQH